jgi:hypothetical protein
MSDDPRRDAAFLTALSESKLGDLLWPEGTIAAVAGIGGGVALHHFVTLSDRLGLVGDSLVMVATMLGIVFAAYALLIALFDREYVVLLAKAKDGVKAFLRPFMLAIGLQVITLMLALTYRVTASALPKTAEFVVFLVWAFLFVYVMADVVALARNVTMHGLLRAEQIRLKDEREGGENGTTVRHMRDRHG